MQPNLHPINDQLPSPKGVALAVLALSRREDVTLGEIALAIQTDPALSSRLIKLANSASQISRPVVSVQEAIARKGVKSVCQLALGFSLIDQYRDGGCAEFDYPRYWSHSLLMALSMQALATRVRVGESSELFICGLLAQIGQLALATLYPQHYSDVLTAYQANPTQSLTEHEAIYLEIDHTELGSTMLADWGIPGVFTKPMALYEGPNHPGNIQDSRTNSLIMMLRLSHWLADLALCDADQRPQLTQVWLTQAAKLDIPAEDAVNLIDDVIAEWHDWGTLLQIHTEPLPSFAEYAQENESIAKDASSLRIVVADSNEFTRRKTMALLAEDGNHTVYAVNDGHTAMALVLEVMPHVIIAHCNLKQMDGMALCQTLRQTGEGQGVYIVLMDDEHNVEHSIRAYEGGADGYVSSTINAKTLHTHLVAAQRMAQMKQVCDKDRTHMRQLAAELDLAKRRIASVADADSRVK